MSDTTTYSYASVTSAHIYALVEMAMADTPLARRYLPLDQQATVEVGGQPHSRDGGRQLILGFQPLERYPGGRETGVSKNW